MWRCSSPDFINVVSLVMSKFSFHTPVHLYLLLQLKGVAVLSSLEKQSIKTCVKIPSQKNKWHFMSHPGAGSGTTNWCELGQNPFHHLPQAEDQALSYTLIPVFILFVFYLSWKEGKVINLPQVNFFVLGGCVLNPWTRMRCWGAEMLCAFLNVFLLCETHFNVFLTWTNANRT